MLKIFLCSALILGGIVSIASAEPITPVFTGVKIEYGVKTPGNVSIGIYDNKGRLMRTLQSGKKTESGTCQIEWDGKDDLAKPLPSGDYTYKGLISNVGWEYQMMMGNSGKPPYLTTDRTGAWGGVHGNIKDTVMDVDGKYVYLLWAHEEGTPALLKIDPKGETGKFKIWGAHQNWAWGFCQAVATDGEYVYVATNDSGLPPSSFGEGKKIARGLIWRVRADTGDYAMYQGGSDGGLIKVSEIQVESLPIETPVWEMYADRTKARSEGFRKNLFGIAVDKSNIYCSLRVENKVVILDKTNGNRVQEIVVQEPAGLAIAPNRNIYVISTNKLLEMSP
ncbi:MAG: hypothetical protein HY350_02550, partial [Candidatus Omnitrophica bacterium]|nr:hypothetical protein [Candidatus Omnitrophota bacterium]